MIPRRLRLRNFLSYQDCTVDFRGLHLAVLCGRNGDGKSALLDAITWALWGEARGRKEDDRIRHDAREMLVELEFEANGGEYVVVRKRTRDRGTGELHLFALEGDGGRVALTGGTIGETQAEITQRLRMDFDTFASSAFIAQGRAGEFTSKPPRERKEVLGKILGLEVYERLSGLANERRRDAVAELKALQGRLEEEFAALEREPDARRAFEEAAAESEALAPCLAEAGRRAEELRQAEREYQRLVDEAVRAREERERHERALHAASEAAATARSELARADALLATAADVEARYGELCAARAEEQSLATAQAEALRLEREAGDARLTIEREQARLEADLKAAADAVAERALRAAGIDGLRAADAAAAAEQEEIAAQRRKLEEAREAAVRCRQDEAAAGNEAQRCKDEAEGLRRRQQQLEEAGGGATCPVCRQPLSEGQLEHVVDEYRAQRKALGEQYRAALVRADEAKAQADTLERDAAEVERALAKGDQELAARRREIHGKLQAAEEAVAELPALRERESCVRAILAAETFATEARARLAAAEAARAAVAYDERAHASVRERIQALAGVEREAQGVRAARETRALLAANVERADTALEDCAKQQKRAAGAACEAERALAEAEDIGPRLREAEAQEAALRERQEALAERRGRLRGLLDQLEELRARVEKARDDEASLREQDGLYADLTKAFGRDGVQAMLVQQAIPLIEARANGLLERMTGGRIRVHLATQRLSARGSVQEVLDIRISDELGTRDYEMYSGGEAFRVDFALRLALARLLAERAGAELPTLIVDEGFGSQDGEGIDRLVEALHAVSQEFRLILVVTHVDELRERFERRIEVTKDPVRGSFARVV